MYINLSKSVPMKKQTKLDGLRVIYIFSKFSFLSELNKTNHNGVFYVKNLYQNTLDLLQTMSHVWYFLHVWNIKN